MIQTLSHGIQDHKKRSRNTEKQSMITYNQYVKKQTVNSY